jgi:hypothetical protein
LVRHDLDMPARVILAVFAVLAIAWLGVLVRDYYVADSASPLLYRESTVSNAKFRAYIDRLRDAELLNPDSSLALARANYLLRRGYPDAALREATPLVRKEPDNISAWGVVYRARRETDPQGAARAAREIKRLDPMHAPD